MWETFTQFLLRAVGDHWTEVVIGVMGPTSVIMWNRIKLRLMRRTVHRLYYELRRVAEPMTMNRENPGNDAFMRSESRDHINELLPRLRRAGLLPPSPMTISDESIQTWFMYLDGIRTDI